MIRLYTGPMFSGKTSALIEIYNNMWNKDNIKVFKPKIDNREFGVLKSRNSKEPIDAILVSSLEEISKYIDKKTKVIFIDEAQFLKGPAVYLLIWSMINDIDIYVSGLNMTSELKPFGLMPELMSIADEINYYHGHCFFCNKAAPYTMYLGGAKEDILVGDNEQGYICVCKNCYVEHKGKENLDVEI